MENDVAAKFIRDNFEPRDQLAVVIVNKQSAAVVQRLASAEQIASAEFQAWLRFENSRKSDIYCTPNVLDSQAHGRTKDDIQSIRHVYLDFDYQGTAAIERLQADSDVPTPNYLVSTSPDKWQALWRVEGFDKAQAEELQRAMAREYGADLAATDCSRVLRLPGFYNHKYATPHYVRASELTREVYSPERFPKFEGDDRGAGAVRAKREGDQGVTVLAIFAHAVPAQLVVVNDPGSKVSEYIQACRVHRTAKAPNIDDRKTVSLLAFGL